jgi:hypothetical protein
MLRCTRDFREAETNLAAWDDAACVELRRIADEYRTLDDDHH